MRLIKSTDDFKLNNHPYPDFPIILNKDMELVWSVHQFLVYFCITRGRVESVNTWWRYGQDLYDYFAYLEELDLDWKASLANSQHSIVASYRDFSVSMGLSSKTINARLRTIIQFYKYAFQKKWIQSVPFDFETVIVSKGKGFLAHTDKSGGLKDTPDVMLKEKASRLQILTKQEVKTLLSYKTIISQHLIYQMALQTGLRKEELLTFPADYIKDPVKHKGSAYVRATLNSRDMEVKSGRGGTKGNKTRDIDIPIALYVKLWQYKIHERNQLLRSNEKPDCKSLFINRFAEQYSIKGSILNNHLKEIVGRAEISLHTLRHTYATFKLYGLRRNPNYKGDPLVYIQDRLGHSSILTTQIYLHYIEELEGELMTEFDQDIDAISMEDA
jgi:site-specific recombinase XerD